MKSWCKAKLFFKNSSSDYLTCSRKVYKRYLCYGVGRFLTFYFISDKCTALQLMFVSNTALTQTLFLCLYDMEMFPKLRSVWQQPLIEISTNWYAAAFQFQSFSSSFFHFLKSFCTFHLCKSVYVLCICKPCALLTLIMKCSHLVFCWPWCFCLFF